MTQLGDFYVKEPSHPDDGGWTPPRLIAIGVLIVLVLSAGFCWYSGGSEEPPVETEAALPPPPPPPPPAPVEPEVESIELPALNDSDAFVGELVAALSAHSSLASWLVTDQMIRRFVVVVDNVAEGTNPAPHLGFMRPELRFGATGAPQRRYDTHAEIIDSIDVAGAAELFLTLEPLLNDAYAELGYPDRPFRQPLALAISQLLEVPADGPVPDVVERGPFFYFTDDTLESLSAAQKQFLGAGPDNVRTIQDALRAIADEIGLQIR